MEQKCKISFKQVKAFNILVFVIKLATSCIVTLNWSPWRNLLHSRVHLQTGSLTDTKSEGAGFTRPTEEISEYNEVVTDVLFTLGQRWWADVRGKQTKSKTFK